jgi:hypothetical protein
MAKLADLFNQSSREIYSKFTPDTGQLVSINPDTRGVLGLTKDTIAYDSRALPISSVVRDVVRVSKLLNPFRNPTLVAKQVLLQTGNTFAQTRKYNIFSPIINTTPFLHSLRSRQADTYLYLQAETLTKVSRMFEGNKVPNDLTNTLILNNIEIGKQQGGSTEQILSGRPEFYTFYLGSTTGPRIFQLTPTMVRDVATPLKPNPSQPYPTDFLQAATNFKQNFILGNKLKENLLASNRKFRLRSSYINDGVDVDTGKSPIGDMVTGSFTNIKDEYNLAKRYIDDASISQDRMDYGIIVTPTQALDQEGKTDIIKFIFSEVGGINVKPVQFRALLSSIKESIKTEFNEQRYVGRTERFVTYGGAKRGVSLVFNIVAFSEEELTGMWTRTNYLSGLAFPKNVINGFMVPPLFNITVGGIYDNQPCYIESLDFDFLDDSITFDINREVPFAINVSMQLSLLEKNSKFHNSPFYKITENIKEEQTLTAEQRARAALNRSGRSPGTLPPQRTSVGVPNNLPVRDLRSSEYYIDYSLATDNPDALIERARDELYVDEYRPPWLFSSPRNPR